MKRSPFVEFPQLQRLMWSAFLHFLLGVFNLTCRSGRCCNDHRTEILGNPILSTSFIGFLMVIHNTRVMVSTQMKNICQMKPFPAFGSQNAFFLKPPGSKQSGLLIIYIYTWKFRDEFFYDCFPRKSFLA